MMFVLGAFAMGVLLGSVNAAAIAYGRVVPFIATLAMFTMARGLALWISDKTPVSIFNSSSSAGSAPARSSAYRRRAPSRLRRSG
jgi:ribose transport system permease protein